MICTERYEKTRGPSMDVKEIMDETGSPMLVVQSEKNNIKYYVKKSNDGFVFYKIEVSKGSPPAKLQGMYTRMESAMKALKEYLRVAPKSQTKQRDRKSVV